MPDGRRGRPTRASADRPNTLGLTRAQLGSLLDRLDFTWSGGDRATRRGFVRWPFRKETVQLRVKHPGGSVSTLKVACRNLSRAGISVLHSAFLHPGAACKVRIPHPSLGAVAVEGRVVRCTHRAGLVHEVGLRFDEEIDVRQFMAHDPFDDFFALETVDPEKLDGRVVCVSAAPIDHKILRHFLKDTRVRLSAAGGVAQGVAMVEEGCDLVVCDLNLGELSGLDAAAAIRGRGIRTPIIVLTTEKSASLRRAAAGCGVDAFLLKPPDHAMVMRAMGEFLIVRRDAVARPPDQTAESGDDPLLELHLESLAAGAVELETAVKRGDTLAARLACLRIAGSAAPGSFAAVRLLALDAAKALASAEGVHAAIAPLRTLVRACLKGPVRRPS